MRSARHDPFKSTVARPAQIHRARTLQPTCALSPRGRRHARQRTSPGAVRVARHRCPERPGRRVLDGMFRKGRGFLRRAKPREFLFFTCVCRVVEIFGEIPPRPGQVGNTWEMHYGTSTGSCGVHLVLLRPSQHSGARPGVVPHHGQILVQSFSLDIWAKSTRLFHTLLAIGILREFSGVHIYASEPILFCT